MKPWFFLLTIFLATDTAFSAGKVSPYRPQFHYSVPKGWMSNPTGLIYHNDEFHIYYQYYPDGIIVHKKNEGIGPLSWGHATSTDLVNWREQPIAISPDKLGQIWGGGIVIDNRNTSGFGKEDENPMVAIFDQNIWPRSLQNQVVSLAYSNDKGRTWTMHPGNPSLLNLAKQVRTAKDPKPFRHGDKWVLAVTMENVVNFYKSTNLKHWQPMSTFKGDGKGSQTGSWKGPDLFPLQLGGVTHWVLLINNDANGILVDPNRDSAVQYFIGKFDGTKFTCSQKEELWVDWGPDFFHTATLTDPETPDKVMSIAWMGNWLYSEVAPTGAEGWRGALTLPREHKLLNLPGGKIRMITLPASEIKEFLQKPMAKFIGQSVIHGAKLPISIPGPGGPLIHIIATIDTTPAFKLSQTYICFKNMFNQEVCVGVWKGSDGIQIGFDRTKTNLKSKLKMQLNSYKRIGKADRQITDAKVKLEIYLDVSSVEIFADGGLTSMTAIFFVDEPLTKIELRHAILPSAIKKGQKPPASSASVDIQVSEIKGGKVTPAPNGGKVLGRSYSIPGIEKQPACFGLCFSRRLGV